MATLSKTENITIFTLASVASGAVGLGAAQDVSTKLGATVMIHLGRSVTTALSNGVKVRIEGSAKASGDSYWFSLAEFLSEITASTTTATLTTATTAGTATLPMTATAGIVIGDKVFILDNTLSNSEWGRVITVNANTSVVIENVTGINHAITTTKVWSKAEFFCAQLDLTSIKRIRVVIDCAYALSGQTIYAEAFMVTGDSIA